MSFVEWLLAGLGLGAVLTVAAPKLIELAFSHFFGRVRDRELEKLKAELRTETETKLEKLKNNLAQEREAELEQIRVKLREEADRRLETLRSDLRAAADVRLEEARSRLNSEVTERLEKARAAQSYRVTTVRDVFEKMVSASSETRRTLFLAAHSYLGHTLIEEHYEISRKGEEELYASFLKSRLDLEKDEVSIVGAVLHAIIKANGRVLLHKTAPSQLTAAEAREMHDSWNDSVEPRLQEFADRVRISFGQTPHSEWKEAPEEEVA